MICIHIYTLSEIYTLLNLFFQTASVRLFFLCINYFFKRKQKRIRALNYLPSTATPPGSCLGFQARNIPSFESQHCKELE